MRYIDADKLINWCNETFKAQTTVAGKEYINAFLQAIVMSETEDVVPRAEYERMCRLAELRKKDHEDTCDLLYEEEAKVEQLQRNLEQAKQEVSREVLDDFAIELHKKIPKRFLDNKAVCHIVLNIIDAVHKKLSWKYIGE